MPAELKRLVSERRRYAGFMVGTVAALAIRDNTLMIIALAVHVFLWLLVLHALTAEIRVVRDVDDIDSDDE
jgi:hypothetical protein